MTMSVFVDNLSRRMLSIDNVYITLWPDSNGQHLSLAEFDVDHFMFSSMLDLSAIPPERSSPAIWCHVLAYMIPYIANRGHDIIELLIDHTHAK